MNALIYNVKFNPNFSLKYNTLAVKISTIKKHY